MSDNVSLSLVMHEYLHHVCRTCMCLSWLLYMCALARVYVNDFSILHTLIQSCEYDTWFYVCTVVYGLYTYVSLHIQMHLAAVSAHVFMCQDMSLFDVCMYTSNGCLFAWPWLVQVHGCNMNCWY